jgi:hypothetical protein
LQREAKKKQDASCNGQQSINDISSYIGFIYSIVQSFLHPLFTALTLVAMKVMNMLVVHAIGSFILKSRGPTIAGTLPHWLLMLFLTKLRTTPRLLKLSSLLLLPLVHHISL